MESLKLLMTSTFYPPYHVGGDAIHVYYLANELVRLGHEVHVIHNLDSYFWQNREMPKADFELSPDERPITHQVRSPFRKLAPLMTYIMDISYPVSKDIDKLVAKVKPDVLHHHNIAGFGPSLLKLKAPRVLYTAHDYWIICQKSTLMRSDRTFCDRPSSCNLCMLASRRPPQLWRYKNLKRLYSKNVDVIIAPSDFMMHQLVSAGLLNEISVIPNFVPNPIIYDSENFEFDFPFFLFAGVLDWHKGILNLLSSFMSIRDDVSAKLLIAGYGPLQRKIEKEIHDNNCSDKVIFLGKVSPIKLMYIYSKALAVVIPSIWPENCPLVALESLACGTPVIASNVGGMHEIVINDIYNKSIIYDPYSDELISILKGIKDKHASKLNYKFSLDSYINRYLDLIS